MFSKNMLSDRIGGLISVIFGILSILEGVRLYPLRQSPVMGDHTMPFLLGAILVILGVLMFLIKQSWFAVEYPPKETRNTMIISMILLFLYAFCIEYLGYLISTLLVTFGLFRVFGAYKWIKCAFMSIVSTGCIYLVFILWLKMPFPAGLIFKLM